MLFDLIFYKFTNLEENINTRKLYTHSFVLLTSPIQWEATVGRIVHWARYPNTIPGRDERRCYRLCKFEIEDIINVI